MRDLQARLGFGFIRHTGSRNVASLKFGEEVAFQFDFSSQSFWKRGSFRSGSKIGIEPEERGVSGTFPAGAPVYGIYNHPATFESARFVRYSAVRSNQQCR